MEDKVVNKSIFEILAPVVTRSYTVSCKIGTSTFSVYLKDLSTSEMEEYLEKYCNEIRKMYRLS